nr:hypothetical protein Iba_chr09aCG8150 [Ipomoea batatas]GMD38789.1 hypothetical protein Iba_chr09fCG7390 [Ipomoea batatas]
MMRSAGSWPDFKACSSLATSSRVCEFTMAALIAIICSGVGAVGLGACSSFGTSGVAGTSPGTNVFTDSFLACSSAS